MSPGMELRAADASPAGPHSFVWTPEALTDIYRDGVNLCVWRRGVDARLSAWLSRLAGAQDLEVIARLGGNALDLRGPLARLLAQGGRL